MSAHIIVARFHTTSSDALLAACDAELLNKCFRSEGLKLDIHEEFYGTVKVDESTFRNMLAGCTTANLCGEKVVAIAIEVGLIDEKSVIVIGGVPHAQYYKM